MKSILVNIALSIASLAIFITLIESTTRIFWYQINIGGYCTIKDKILIHVNKPECVYELKKTEGNKLIKFDINECGHRESRTCKEYINEQNNIYAIGDSFTFGSMVEESKTYVRVAEGKLKKTNINYNYINTGVGGWDLQQYNNHLDSVIKNRPQIITIGLLPNDFFADISQEGISQRTNLLDSTDPESLYDHIYSSNLPLLERLTKKIISKSMFVDFLTHIFLSNSKIYSKIYRQRSSGESFVSKSYENEWNKKMRDAELIFQEMSKKVSYSNSKIVLIIIPQRIQALILEKPDMLSGLDANTFSNEIKEIAYRSNFIVFDFLEVLKKIEAPTKLYYPVDGHLNQDGQELLGEFVGEN